MNACVITNMLPFWHSNIVTDVDCDSGKLFKCFHGICQHFYNVSQCFYDDSYSIHFDCGII